MKFDEFLKTNKNKKIVGVQGLGFVGAIMSLVLTNCKKEEYAVIGVDINEDIIDSLNNGKLHISSSDPKVEIYFKNTIDKRNLFVTSDSSCFSKCDIIIVDINLDVKKNDNFKTNNTNEYDIIIEPFKKGMKLIGMNCKKDALIIIETTVPPGTCEKIAFPIILESLKERGLETNLLKMGHSYERVMPGPNYIDSIENFPRAYSGINKNSKIATAKFLNTIINVEKFPLQPLKNITSSETAKVLENSYRAMNIAFIDEWSKFAEVSGVDLFEVIDTIRIRPTHKNIMYPGFGVGGYCLTKDPLLASWSSQKLFNSNKLEQSESSVAINDRMPFHILKKIKELSIKSPSILVLGISYLKDVGDMRYAPFLSIEKKLKTISSKLMTYDPFISKPDYDTNNWEDIINKKFDIIIIGSPHSIFIENHNIKEISFLNKDAIFIDPFNIVSNLKINNKIITIGNGS
tara:strand:- start:3870 stop:5249 length:1380 start_codon:yes stop_codon:yes gene_type:complete